MTAKEQKIRQLWLILYILSIVAANITTYLFPPENITTLPLVCGTVGGLLIFWLVTYCAYLKQGTKLLTFFLWALPISSIITIAFQLFSQIPFRTFDFFFYPITVIWYYLTFQLRKINRKQAAA